MVKTKEKNCSQLTSLVAILSSIGDSSCIIFRRTSEINQQISLTSWGYHGAKCSEKDARHTQGGNEIH